jgi:hypothetical protein
MTNSNISVLNNYLIFEIFMMKKKKKNPLQNIYIFIKDSLFNLKKKSTLKKLLFENFIVSENIHTIIHVGRSCQGSQRKTKSELLGFIIL